MVIMGILNVTPDSFSDGGRFLDTQAAIDHGLRLAEEGADILDIGGESTRPGAPEVDEAEELARVVPVIEALAGQSPIPLSIDTRKPAVARAAIEAGAAIVNDVEANRSDETMWQVVAESGAGYVAMHMQGTPGNMQDAPEYDDVLADVDAFFRERLEALARAGVSTEQVVLDPGIGFGKTLEHNLRLLGGLNRFKKGRRPLLLGASRKSFMGKLLGVNVEQRLPGSLASACWAVECGVEMLRVHDVAETVQAVRLYESMKQHA